MQVQPLALGSDLEEATRLHLQARVPTRGGAALRTAYLTNPQRLCVEPGDRAVGAEAPPWPCQLQLNRQIWGLRRMQK